MSSLIFLFKEKKHAILITTNAFAWHNIVIYVSKTLQERTSQFILRTHERTFVYKEKILIYSFKINSLPIYLHCYLPHTHYDILETIKERIITKILKLKQVLLNWETFKLH